MTLGAWLTDWVQLYVQPSGLADNSKRNYDNSARRIAAAIGGIEMQDLTALDVQRYCITAAREHPRAAQLDRAAISVAIKLAHKLGLTSCIIDRDTVPTPQHHARKAAILQPEQCAAYLTYAREMGAVGFVLTMCCYGLRRSEAMGLCWSDIDRESCTVRVIHQRASCTGAVVLAPLKSSHSARTLQLPDTAFAALSGLCGLGDAIICPIPHRSLYRAHRAILCAIGADDSGVTLHGLRHSFATACVRQGCDLKTLQQLLGHATIGITADLYADHAPDVCPSPLGLYSVG